jgi:hypothetical protein
MDLEQPAANPAEGGVVAPIQEPEVVNLDAQQAPEAEANTPAVGSDEDLVKLGLGDPENAPEPQIIEVEVDGKKIKVSEDGKDFLLRQADYTKKTTEVARERETVQAEKARIEQIRHVQEAVINSRATLRALDMQIEQLANTPIGGLPQEQVNAMQARLLQLQAERQEVNADVDAIAQIENQRLSEEYGKQREEALSEAAKIIPNFDDKRRVELETLAVDLGIPKEDVEATADPAAYRILHLADIGKKFLERQQNAEKIQSAQAGNPTARLEGMADGGKRPEEMTMAEYAAARKAGKI